MATLRTSGQITDVAFLAAYNDVNLTNEQVATQLETDWTTAKVKLRSTRISLHLTVKRDTAKSGGVPTLLPESELSLEAKQWLVDKTVQVQGTGPYVPLADRTTSETPTETPAATGVPTTANAPVTTSTPTGTVTELAFSFTAEIFGTPYNITGPSRDAALNSLWAKLQEMNFSKIQITSQTGQVISVNDISNTGYYKFTKQLTAAA